MRLMFYSAVFILAHTLAFRVRSLSRVVPSNLTWSLYCTFVFPTYMEAMSEVVGFLFVKKISSILVSFTHRWSMYIQFLISSMLFPKNNFACVFLGLKPYARVWSSACPDKTESWSFVILSWRVLT